MIKFPKVHIAESVTNRILNIADGIAENASLVAHRDAPALVPDTAIQSAVLDARLSQPPSDALPAIDQSPDPGATASGAPLLDTLLTPGA